MLLLADINQYELDEKQNQRLLFTCDTIIQHIVRYYSMLYTKQ